MTLAQHGNYYFDQTQPWTLIKTDPERCKTVLHLCLKIIHTLAIIMMPYLPFSSTSILQQIGFKQKIHHLYIWEN